MEAETGEAELNRRAGKMLKSAREATPGASKAILFAPALSRRLGIELPPSTLSNYETGRRPVPAAILLAAAELSGRSLDELARDDRLQARFRVIEDRLGRLEDSPATDT